MHQSIKEGVRHNAGMCSARVAAKDGRQRSSDATTRRHSNTGDAHIRSHQVHSQLFDVAFQLSYCMKSIYPIVFCTTNTNIVSIEES